MITKHDALTEKNFIYINNGKSVRYRTNGKCKTWIRDAMRFKLPIKHGLYGPYGYITEDNAHLFDIDRN